MVVFVTMFVVLSFAYLVLSNRNRPVAKLPPALDALLSESGEKHRDTEMDVSTSSTVH